MFFKVLQNFEQGKINRRKLFETLDLTARAASVTGSAAYAQQGDAPPSQEIGMAHEVGLIDTYGPQAKMYSKLVHPTALSIASSTMAGSLNALMPLVESQAGSDLLMIYSCIEDHVEAHGVAPKR